MDDREYEDFQRFRRRKRRRKIRKAILTFILVLVIVLAAGAALLWKAGPLKHKAAEAVSNKVMEGAADSAAQQIEQATGGAVTTDQAKQQIQQAMDSMTPEDRETLTRMIENHMDGSTIADITQYVAGGDMQGAETYAQQHLTPEENQELQGLLSKYLGSYGVSQ